MLSALALWALAQAGAATPAQAPLRARMIATARIISAAEVRQGQTSEPHQRRPAVKNGERLTLLEFQ